MKVAVDRPGKFSALCRVAPTYRLSQVISVKGQQIAEGSMQSAVTSPELKTDG